MNINIRLLKAAAMFASKEETRYYLKGVAVQAGPRGVYLVSTDSHRLLAFRQSADDTPPVDIIIPADVIARIKLDRHVEDATLTRDGDTQWRIDYCGTAISFAPIDGTFPDWRRIVPRKVDGCVAQFDPAYVGDFAKVAKALGLSNTRVVIGHNGQGPALVSFGDDVDGFGVLMPMRAPSGVEVPAWLDAPASVEKAD